MTALNYKLLNLVPLKSIYNWSVNYGLSNSNIFLDNFEKVKIKQLLKRNKTIVNIEDEILYKRVTIKLYGGGVRERDKVFGNEIKTKRQFLLKKQQFLYSRIDARNGAFGLANSKVDDSIVTNDFPVFDINTNLIIPEYLSLITGSKQFFDYCQNLSSGTTGRQRINEDSFLDFEIPLPKISNQKRLIANYNQKLRRAQDAENEANELEKNIENYLLSELGIEKPKAVDRKEGLQFVKFKDMNSWSIDKISYHGKNRFKNSKKLSDELLIDAFRGKSPKYEELGECIVLNQKCNRWNEIKLEFAKTVNKGWFNSINKKFKTVENDILINSTGDGTIGRSSLVTKGFENLIYDSHILLLRLNQEVINPIFFVYQFNSSFIQNQIEQIKSAQSTKQTELGLENLYKLNFAIPERIYDKNGKIDIEKDIQTRIANYITTEKEKIKSLRQQAKEFRKQAKEAFENEIFA